ncbi:MAG TPA: nitroreductase family protein [Syntrophorhabdales bacterium]|nr:nitroreductase family protein [Syntrophorhabdales bacterium]
MLADLVKANRSYRRFQEDKPVAHETLRQLVDLTRYAASAQNLQPLKYILSSTPEKNSLIFPHLAWAGYLKEWPGPEEGERPAAYIIILGDREITRNYYCNDGIAAQTMLLAAVELGLQGCMIANIQREKLRAALNIPEKYDIMLAIAFGYPNETVVLEEVKNGDIRYWRDEKSVHHVPKRSLSEIILDL